MSTLYQSIANELSAKIQWAGGAIGAVGSGVFTFLSDNYQIIGSIGVLVGIGVGFHGAYWLHKVKKLQAAREQLQIDLLLDNAQ